MFFFQSHQIPPFIISILTFCTFRERMGKMLLFFTFQWRRLKQFFPFFSFLSIHQNLRLFVINSSTFTPIHQPFPSPNSFFSYPPNPPKFSTFLQLPFPLPKPICFLSANSEKKCKIGTTNYLCFDEIKMQNECSLNEQRVSEWYK